MMAGVPKILMSTRVGPVNLWWDHIFDPPLRTHTFHDTKIVDSHVALPNNLKYWKIAFIFFFQNLSKNMNKKINKKTRTEQKLQIR